MKKIIALIFFISTLLISTVSAQQYTTDIIVTSPDGIWTDSRAYATLNDAVTAIGTNQRVIVVAKQEVVTTLTIPANVTLRFEKNGSIANSSQLTINTKNIEADNHQIFTGVGNIDFASGTILKSSWFQNIESAFALTADDTITLIVSKSQTITTSYSPGNNVHLKWESPGNILTVNAGVTVDNISQVTAGNYQLFAGAGNFRFLDGTSINLDWFSNLRAAITYASTNKLTLIVQGNHTIDYSDTVPSTLSIKMNQGGTFAISTGITLTINGYLEAGLYQVFNCVGTGKVSFESGSVKEVYPDWWTENAVPGVTDMTAACNAAVESIYNTGGKVKFSGNIYLLNGVAGADTYKNGILIRSKSINLQPIESITLEGFPGKTILKGNSDDMVVIRISRKETTVRDLTIDNTSKINTIGIGIMAEDITDTITLMSNSNFSAENVAIINQYIGMRFQPGPSVGGSASGCHYHSIRKCIINLCTNSVLMVASATPLDINRVTRTSFIDTTFARGNTGVLIEKGTEIDFISCFWEHFNASYGVGLSATPTAFNYTDINSSNIRLIGGYAEDCTISVKATNPKDVYLIGYDHSGATDSSELGMGRQRRYWLNIPKTLNTTAYLSLGNTDFVGFEADPNADGSKTLILTTNGIERERWFNGVRTTTGDSQQYPTTGNTTVYRSLNHYNGQSLQYVSSTSLVTINAAAYTNSSIYFPANSIAVAASVRVVTEIPDITDFTVGDSGDAARYSTAAVSGAVGSTDVGTKAGNYYIGTSPLAIRITPNIPPSAATGSVRLTIYYYVVIPPTS